MGRSPCCDESGLKKGPWTPEEDDKLIKYIQKHGHGSWRALPKLAGLNRCGKSCRLRWTNYLRPDIKRGKFSQEEEQTILNLHAILGNKWSAIATHLPGRTDNEIKNFWNTHLKKKLIQMGFDPMTHRPRTDIFSSLPHLIALANLKELLENHSWEEQAVMLRLQTEAAQVAKLQYLNYLLQPNTSTPPTSSSMPTNHFPASGVGPVDSGTFNLLNSLCSMKDSSVLSIDNAPNHHQTLSLGTNNNNNSNTSTISSTSFQALYDSIPFSHMPDLECPQAPIKGSACNFTSMHQGENNNTTAGPTPTTTTASPSSPWQLPLASLSSSPSQVGPPLATENSINNNIGDACSTSSYAGANSMWADLLLEESLFHEMA